MIPRNSERYLTFNYGYLHFKDSYQFLAESLVTLVNNLERKVQTDLEITIGL